MKNMDEHKSNNYQRKIGIDESQERSIDLSINNRSDTNCWFQNSDSSYLDYVSLDGVWAKAV